VGDVVVLGWPTLAVLIGAAVLLWVLARTSRHRLRWARVPLGAMAALTLMLAVAAAVNDHYAYLPRVRDVVDLLDPGAAYPTVSAHALQTPAAQHRPGGAIVRLRVPDGHDGLGSSSALIYLPSAYFEHPGRQFPVVYLIHGSPGSAEDWFRAAEAARLGADLALAGAPTVLVAPRMSRSWLDDSECVDGRHEAVETHLLTVVMPTVENVLRVRRDRDDRTIAGNSAGGFCALNLGLRHREVFATILDLSGETGPSHSGGMSALFGRVSNLAEVVAENTPSAYAPRLPVGPPVRIWLDCGSGDRAVAHELVAFATSLRGRMDLHVRLVLRRGGHTYGVWRPALRQALTWATTDRLR
jgi:enterochelin esterase-like enzyme